MRQLRILAIAEALWMALFPIWLIVTPSVALGAETAACSEFPATSRWQGQQVSTSTGQRHGAQAIFEGSSLSQCTSPGFPEFSGSFVFSNVVPTNGGFNDIVQVGAGNCRAPNCTGGMHHYSAWGRSTSTPGCSQFANTPPIANEGPSWTAVNHIYRVQHSGDLWRMFADSTQLSYTHELNICWTPKSSVWFAESWDAGDQIGGTPTNKFSITQASYMTAEGGAWVIPSFNAAGACTYVASFGVYHCDVTGSRSLDIWTDR